MTDSLAERLAELERAREDADRLYNQALTALDRALGRPSDLPHPPPAYDATRLADLNDTWNLLPAGSPVIDRSLKGRLRGLVWRMVGPALETQQRFNAALVDHLNRNATAHAEAARAIASTIALVRDRINAELVFQSHLIQFLQTITLYVDTKDRATAGGQDVLNAALGAMTDTWLKHWESLGTRERRFVDRLSAIDDVRATASIAQQTALDLKREVEKLLAGPGAPDVPGAPGAPGAPDLNAFKYLAFEDQFRGSVDDIGGRLKDYVALFQGQTDVLDIGCGRGEFLELLAAAGVRARGLDINLAMVEASRARGLDVSQGDALSYISSLPDASLGGLFAAQVAEHLPPDYLSTLLETAAHKIRAGGVIVLETINPACWVAFFDSYIRDLTHVRPLHPDTLQYLVRVSGFPQVSVAFTSPVAAADRLQRIRPVPADAPPAIIEIVDVINDNLDKLNARMFTHRDYAVIGRK